MRFDISLKTFFMNFPDKLKYTKDHEWVSIDGDIATVGVTDFAQHELGDIVYVEVDTKGKSLSKETVFGTIEAVKTVSDLFIPVSGTVTEVNALLESEPEKVNSDPYGDGWIVKIKVDDPADVAGLMDADSYQKLVS